MAVNQINKSVDVEETSGDMPCFIHKNWLVRDGKASGVRRFEHHAGLRRKEIGVKS